MTADMTAGAFPRYEDRMNQFDKLTTGAELQLSPPDEMPLVDLP